MMPHWTHKINGYRFDYTGPFLRVRHKGDGYAQDEHIRVFSERHALEAMRFVLYPERGWMKRLYEKYRTTSNP